MNSFETPLKIHTPFSAAAKYKVNTKTGQQITENMSLNQLDAFIDNSILSLCLFREEKVGIQEIQTQVVQICRRMNNFHMKIHVQNRTNQSEKQNKKKQHDRGIQIMNNTANKNHDIPPYPCSCYS